MAGYCVIVVSADRARMFSSRDAVYAETGAGPHLVESAEMQIVSEVEGDADFGADGSRDLVRKLIADSLHMLRRNNGHTLILVGTAATLTVLRRACSLAESAHAEILEFEGDLIAQTADEIHDILSKEGLLPERTTAADRHAG